MCITLKQKKYYMTKSLTLVCHAEISEVTYRQLNNMINQFYVSSYTLH